MSSGLFNRLIASRHPGLVQLPGPPPGFPHGNLFDFVRYEPWEIVDRYHAAYGKVFRAWLGPVPVLFMFDAQGAQEVFVTKAADFIKGEPTTALGAVLGDTSPFSTNGAQWERNRKNSFLENPHWREWEEGFFRDLGARIPQLMRKHRLFDTGDGLERRVMPFVFDVMGLALLGEEVNDGARRAFLALGRHGDLSIKLNFPVVSPGFYLNRARWRRFWEERVAANSAPGAKPTNGIVGFFARSAPVCRHHFANELGNAFWGGMYSIHAVFLNTLFELARHPSVGERLAGELADANASYAATAGNGLLESVLRESMRCRPVIPLFGRTVVADSTEVAGVTLKQGTKIFFSCRPFHFDPTVWESPRSFRPERWDAATIEAHPFGSSYFLPFGIGPRQCVGQHFALYLLRAMLPAVLREGRPEFQGDTLKSKFFFGCQLPKQVHGGFRQTGLTPADGGSRSA